MTPEERAAESAIVCRSAMAAWLAKTEEERKVIEWMDDRAPGEEILRRWAREVRERASA